MNKSNRKKAISRIEMKSVQMKILNWLTMKVKKTKVLRTRPRRSLSQSRIKIIRKKKKRNNYSNGLSNKAAPKIMGTMLMH